MADIKKIPGNILKQGNVFSFIAGFALGILVMIISFLFPIESIQKNINDPNDINHSINRIILTIKDAEATINSQDVETSVSLNQTVDNLLKLRFYYIPMTEVRQLIYNADILFNEKKYNESINTLRKASEILKMIDNDGGDKIKQPLKELYIMIDAVIYDIGERTDNVSDDFRQLGHKVDLMVIKGELILGDIKFKNL